jgi:mRNA-degrading endonuclease toxin of MazEF toxin-antitoxin module
MPCAILLAGGYDMSIDYQAVKEFMEWVKTKAELKFDPQPKKFPIYYNSIYWAHMGCNIGSEEGKHRPVVITRTCRNSSIVAVIPLTTQRLNDKYQFHVDLEAIDSTALVEQMRTIDIARIDKPMLMGGKIVSLTDNDWNSIDLQVRQQYLMSKPVAKK